MFVSISSILRKIAAGVIDVTKSGKQMLDIVSQYSGPKFNAQLRDIRRGVLDAAPFCDEILDKAKKVEGLSDQKRTELTSKLEALAKKSDPKGMVKYLTNFALAWKAPVIN